MKIINTSPDRTIQIGYEGEDRVTVLRFRYPYEWLSYGEGVFTVRVRRHGEHTAYNAQLVMDDRENTTLFMTATNVELSVKGSGEMQVVYSGADFVKKSPIYSYNVSRAVDEVADPPAEDVYTQIIESLSDLQTDVQGLSDAVEDIGDISLLTTTAKTDLVSAINEVNAKDVVVDDALSDTSENPVRNKAITRSIRELSGYAHDLSGVIDGLGEDVEGLETAIQSKADIQTVSAIADAVNGIDTDVQGLQTAVQAKADTATVTALSGTVSGLQTDKADKSYVDTQLAGKASTQTVSDLADDVSNLQTGLASKVDDVWLDGISVIAGGVAKITTGNGVTKTGNQIKANTATENGIKGGTSSATLLNPARQHYSAFYGLAKAAGHDEKNSTLPVGTYSEEAKIAIQKMLGIYEAPWELINEETFTNETEADYIITTDANGNAFELTDLVIIFETPKQAVRATKGYFGHIWCYYGNGDSQYMSLECGAWGQNANESYHTCGGMIENKGGLMVSTIIVNSTGGARTPVNQQLITGFQIEPPMSFIRSSLTFTKINIRAVTGTGHYRLYGKRKWT